MSKYLMARVIEGVDEWFPLMYKENGSCDFVRKDNDTVCITADCTQEGFNSLYDIGKKLWDSNVCSKFEIAAFDSGRLFWKHRPDMYNFERNSYKNRFEKVIEEEFKSFSSDDFQNDTLEMEYITDYQKRFWLGKTDIYTVEAFENLLKDTEFYNDLNVVRSWMDKKEAEVPLDVLSNMSFVPYDCGFEHNGQHILNPFYDGSLRFGVKPVEYYGEENIRRYVENMKHVIVDLERKPLAEQIQNAGNSRACDKPVKDKKIEQNGFDRE